MTTTPQQGPQNRIVGYHGVRKLLQWRRHGEWVGQSPLEISAKNLFHIWVGVPCMYHCDFLLLASNKKLTPSLFGLPMPLVSTQLLMCLFVGLFV